MNRFVKQKSLISCVRLQMISEVLRKNFPGKFLEIDKKAVWQRLESCINTYRKTTLRIFFVGILQSYENVFSRRALGLCCYYPRYPLLFTLWLIFKYDLYTVDLTWENTDFCFEVQGSYYITINKFCMKKIYHKWNEKPTPWYLKLTPVITYYSR